MRFNPRLLLLVLPFVWALLLFDFGIFTGGDNAYYLILAKSIALEQEYSDISAPGSPPATHFPPLLPLVLSPLVLLFGHNYIPEKILVVLVFGVSLILCFHLFRRLLGEESEGNAARNCLLLLVLAYGFNLVAVEHSHHILSEMPFISLSLVSIFLFVRYLDTRRPWLMIWAIAAGALTFHLRTIGFTLVLSELVVLSIHERKKSVIGVGICVLVVLPWLLRNFLVSGSTSNYIQVFLAKNVYATELGTIAPGDLMSRLITNSTAFAFRVYGELLVSKTAHWGVSVFLVLVTVLGIVEALRNHRLRMLGIYLVVYNLFLLLWHWYDTRYALPVLPVFLMCMYLGARRLSILIKDRLRLLAFAILSIILLSNIYSGSLILPQRWNANSKWLSGDKLKPYPENFANYFEVALFAKAVTPEEAVFCARKPSLFYWFSERKSIVYPYSTNPQEIWSFFEENKVRYVVLDTFFSTTQLYLVPALVGMRDELRLVYETTSYPKVQLLSVGGANP